MAYLGDLTYNNSWGGINGIYVGDFPPYSPWQQPSAPAPMPLPFYPQVIATNRSVSAPEPEKRCPYCNRLSKHDGETCAGCGAPL